jgi:diguanylate cyclase (GGDEF)-like protein
MQAPVAAHGPITEHARLAPDEEERTFDIERRLRVRRVVNTAAVLLAIFASVPWLGWDPVFLCPFIVVALVASDRCAHLSSRPELVIFAGFIATLLGAGGVAALSGGVKSPALVSVVIPVYSVTLRFQGRLLITGLVVCVLTAIAVCVAASPAPFIANPTPLFFVLAAMITIGSVAEATQRMEMHHRTQAVIDPLTGLFNRSSLLQRFYECQEQSRITGRSLSIVVCDIDHFKRVNDEYGHGQGDHVLVDVASTMRESLRHGDLAYRLGGEEFVILLPGIGMELAVAAAERLRNAIGASNPAGIPMTMSFGVATWEPGHGDWAALYEVADAQMYMAKQAGRDRVRPVVRPAG